MSTKFFLAVISLSTLTKAEDISIKPGDDVTLDCQSPRDINLFYWSRPELKAEGFIFFFRDNRSYDHYQHPTVKGRVQLRDGSSMKDGNVSVILKNVTINDSGTYECHVAVNNKEPELRNIIILKVEDSGHTDGGVKDGNMHQRVGLIVAVGLILVCFVFMIFMMKRINKNSNLPPVEAEML